MKIKINKAPIFILLILLILSACQGSKNKKVDQNATNSESTTELTETIAEVKVYTDPDDVKIMLDEMGRIRHEQWQTQLGWWDEQKTIQSQSGNFYGINREWWFQYNDAATCPTILQIISQEDGKNLETSLLIDEKAVPEKSKSQDNSNHKNRITLVKLTDQSCSFLMETSLTQIEQLLDSSKLVSIQATIQNDILTITCSQEDDPYYQETTLRLDTITGFLLYEKDQLYSHNRTYLEGEIEYTYSYQHYDELPQEIQSIVDQGLAQP